VALLTGSHRPATLGQEMEIDLTTFETRWIGAARPDCDVCRTRREAAA
jgi:hypothetical protein